MEIVLFFIVLAGLTAFWAWLDKIAIKRAEQQFKARLLFALDEIDKRKNK